MNNHQTWLVIELRDASGRVIDSESIHKSEHDDDRGFMGRACAIYEYLLHRNSIAYEKIPRFEQSR